MAGDVGARLRRRLCDRQSDRRADLARRRPRTSAPRRSPATASTGRSASNTSPSSATSLSGDLGRSFVFGMPVLELILSAPAGDARAHPRRGDRRHARSASRSACMPATGRTAPAREGHHGGVDPRLLGADLLGRADPDPDLRGPSRLAAGRAAAARHGSLFGVEWSFLTLDGWKHLILPALNLALFKLAMMIRLARAGTREVMLTDTVKFARAAGLSECDDPAPARAEADLDPDRDGVRARVRLDARLRGRDRDDLLLARHRQADHRFDHRRSTGR